MKIALFGGRFDPPHNGHTAIANEILKVEDIDEVWLVPDNKHQWNPIIASTTDRLKMLELMIQDSRFKIQDLRIKVSDVAIRLGGSTVTYDVVSQLKTETNYEFVFVCGSDQIPSFHKWTKWNELEKVLTFIIIARKDYPVENLPTNCRLLSDKSYEPLEDSSTKIRQLLKEGKSIHGLVPEKVEEYIIEHKLYK